MTGFGRSSQRMAEDGLLAECEIKSLNSRYLDLVLRLPRSLTDSEYEIRRFLSEHLARGKVELSLSLKSVDQKKEKTADLAAIKDRLDQTEKIFLQLGAVFSDADKSSLISRALNDASDSSNDEQIPFIKIKAVLEQAITAIKQQRQQEGQLIVKDMLTRLQTIESTVSSVENLLQKQPEIIQDRLKNRLDKVLADKAELDPARLMQEVAILVDRSDVSEELLRLKAHLSSFKSVLSGKGAVGKKSDFFCQEIFRELNTLGNKAANAAIQASMVDCKVELEKVREQVQNLE